MRGYPHQEFHHDHTKTKRGIPMIWDAVRIASRMSAAVGASSATSQFSCGQKFAMNAGRTGAGLKSIWRGSTQDVPASSYAAYSGTYHHLAALRMLQGLHMDKTFWVRCVLYDDNHPKFRGEPPGVPQDDGRSVRCGPFLYVSSRVRMMTR